MKRIGTWILICILLTGCAKSNTEVRDWGTTGSDWVLTQPPTLEFFSGEETGTAVINGYSWSYDNFDGAWNSMETDGLHPLDCGEYMDTVMAQAETLTLVFGAAPESYTVRCWPDTAIENREEAREQTPVTDGWEISLLEGGYVYQVIAKFEYESFRGTAYYCFHVLRDTHTHVAADQPQTVAEPLSGYCGNITATVNRNGAEYSLTGSDAITLTDISINLAYQPENVCRCLAEFSVITEDGTVYAVNLTEAFIRCDAGQASLTAEQVEQINAVLETIA